MSNRDLVKHIEELSPEKRALLLQRLREKKDQRGSSNITIPRQSGKSNALAVSFAQQRLWFLDQYEPNSPEYNIPQAIQMSGVLHLAILHQALEAIAARHESLRTTFASVDGKPVQIISERGAVDLPLIDLRDCPAADRQAEAHRRMDEEAQHPFDLARGPLMRATLLRLGDDEHVLLLTMHHIVSDGWSRGVFMHELAVLYEAFSKGKPSPLPELPIQYADFALWQRQWLQGEILEEQLAYWKKQLADVQVLDLPTDHPRPAVRTYHGGIESLTLPRTLSKALTALGQQEGATLFMTLLATFQALLYRYTQQKDIAVGTLIANRRWAQTEKLIGFFANTLVLRTELADRQSFRELLRRVREAALEAYAHQDLPFEKLVDDLHLKRDVSRTPLFQVMFILQNVPASSISLPGLTLGFLEADSRTAKFDVTLYMMDTAGGLLAQLEYNTDLFDASTARRMLGHLQVSLEGAASQPDRRISELPLLATQEQSQLLEAWNSTWANYPQNTTIHQLFQAQVEQTPDAVAVVFEDEQLTYRELDRRANLLAHYLRASGVGVPVPVGICMGRSLEMTIGVLGILKAGGTYVPLDPDYPQERLAFMLQDAHLPILLILACQAAACQRLRTGSPETGQAFTTVPLDTDWKTIADAARGNVADPAGETAAENLAYITYTSGSTGKPKGVQISHAAVVNFLEAMRRQLELTDRDILLAVTTLSFDIAGLELYLPLIVGARLVIASREVASDGERLCALLSESGATTMQATPASWRLLLGAGWSGNKHFKILCGGEALPRELADQLLDKSALLWNLYGPTEATIWSAACLVDSKESPISIGRPIANTHIYLLDAHLQPVPIGIPGELYIGGHGLSRGYLNRPDLTADKFIPDPFASPSHSPTKENGGTRLYKTGDLARHLPDGRIEFLGRKDYQVKVRGFRIELGEIETALSQHPAVRQAVVMTREDVPGDKRLAAYLVVSQEQPPAISDLRRFLKEKLPEYMVPSTFTLLEDLPLTPNGKVDRRALPAPDSARPELQGAFVAPRTPAEEALARIWAEFLGLEHVGVHDNFFDLGGDSLMVIRIVGKARLAGLTFTTKQFFQHQTIAELASVVGQAKTYAEQGLVTGPLPLTFAMHQFFELDHPNPNYYAISYLLEARQALDPASLEKAIQQLLLYHDAFRVRLVAGDSGPQLANDGPGETVSFQWVDLSALPEEKQPAAIQAAQDAVESSFDMFKGKLFKAVLFDFGPRRPHHMLLSGHYLTADVISWQIFISDLDVVYRQIHRGEPVRLPPKTTSVKQCTERIVEYARSFDILPEIPYWLAEPRAQIAPLPRDDPKGVNTVESSCRMTVALSVQETRTLQALAQSFNTQIDAVLLTAVTLAFTQWTGSPALLIDLFVLGRESPFEDVDLSRTVGWLTFCYPLLLSLKVGCTPGEALKSIAEQLGRVPSKGIGYPALRYVRRDGDLTKRMQALPTPEIFFNFFGPPLGGLETFEATEWSSAHRHDPQATRPRLFAVGGDIVEGQLELILEYSENIHRRATVEGLIRSCRETLQSLIREKETILT